MGFLKKILGKDSGTSDGGGGEESSLSLHEVQELLAQSENPSPEFRSRQKEKFLKKFGREPVPGKDPLFFDPDAETPVQLTAERLKAIVTSKLSAAKAAGIEPQTDSDRAAIREAIEKAKSAGQGSD